MSNYTIKEENTLLSIETEEAQKIFLKYKNKNYLMAERCAWEWDILESFLKPILPLAASSIPVDDIRKIETIEEVLEFIKQRQIRRYFKGY